MLEVLWWIAVGFVALLAIAFVSRGLRGATWVINSVLWLSGQALGWVIRGAIRLSKLVIRFGAVSGKRLTQMKAPSLPPAKEKLTLQVALLRSVVVALLVAIWLMRAGWPVLTVPKSEAKPGLGKAPITSGGMMYDMDTLSGRNFGDLFAAYTGISGHVGSAESVDFCQNLRALWDRKVRVSGGNPVVRESSTQLVGAYCLGQPTSMNVAEYRQVAGEVLSRTRGDLNWSRLAQIHRLDSRKLAVLRRIVDALDGDDLVAYALTELMPGVDGKLNVAVLDFLLQNAGREYVESIPAVYDPYTSFGPYQFTQFAWYDAGGERRGGSRVNPALGTPVPHGSVQQLRADQHHIAAFLFAVDNLSYTIRWLNARQLSVLERNWRSSHSEIVQFIATAHHAPYGSNGAQGAFQRWLDNNAGRDFSVSLRGRLINYARKTRANLEAVKGL